MNLRQFRLYAVAAIGLGAASPALVGEARSAGAQAFDGAWQVVMMCNVSRDGAKSYTWRFSADVRGGSLVGQYGERGVVNSGTLTGRIAASGDALLTMKGLTGDPGYTLTHAKAGTAFHYTVTAHFDATHGTGKRNEDRDCSLDFSKT